MDNIRWFAEEGARAIQAGDWEAYGRIFAPDLAMTAPGLSETMRGREARVQYVQGIMRAFPDGTVEVQNAFGHGDWACLQVMFSGTNTGPLATPDGGEIPPTGKSVRFPYCVVARFKDGEAIQIDEYFDQLALLTQLGVGD